jgi:hypothetical protein
VVNPEEASVGRDWTTQNPFRETYDPFLSESTHRSFPIPRNWDRVVGYIDAPCSQSHPADTP